MPAYSYYYLAPWWLNFPSEPCLKKGGQLSRSLKRLLSPQVFTEGWWPKIKLQLGFTYHSIFLEQQVECILEMDVF